MKKTRIIAFANQKGGVGKTTSAINIAAVLGSMGKSVLVIDGDPQSNSTIGLGVANDIDLLEDMITVYECIMEDMPLTDAIIKTEFKNVDIVPSGLKLADADQELVVVMNREKKLKKNLDKCMDQLKYDYILIDMGPSLGLINTNCLLTADEIIIPVKGVFAVSGIKRLQKYIKKIRDDLDHDIKLTGVLLTDVSIGNNLTYDILTEVKSYFEDKIFKNVIRHTVKVDESQWDMKPLLYYNPKCTASEDYIAVTKEVIERGYSK